MRLLQQLLCQLHVAVLNGTQAADCFLLAFLIAEAGEGLDRKSVV